MRFTKRSSRALLSTKGQFHPHCKDMAASEGKGEEGFSCGCNWDLGEAETEMALEEVFIARKKAFFG